MVFTIHNAEFGLDRIGRAAYFCQRFTTVSPSYAAEARARCCCCLCALLAFSVPAAHLD